MKRLANSNSVFNHAYREKYKKIHAFIPLREIREIFIREIFYSFYFLYYARISLVISIRILGIHMVEFFGTDYLANSMLYHAFRQKYMDLKIGPESSNRLENLLFTSCKVGFCVGEQLGLLSEQFPDREIEIHFFARKV